MNNTRVAAPMEFRVSIFCHNDNKKLIGSYQRNLYRCSSKGLHIMPMGDCVLT